MAEWRSPQIHVFKPYPPAAPQNVAIFGDKVFKEAIKFKLGHVGEPLSLIHI